MYNMEEEFIIKIGYYSIFKIKTIKSIKYKIDSGKTLFIKKYKKFIPNPYRDEKEFDDIEEAKKYIKSKLSKKTKEKYKKISKLPKSLYLILIKEESSDTLFVKVGITSKRFIIRRFSKKYGYDGYSVETILRRIDSPDAEKLEKNIKDRLNKKRSVKKYRPILESFSGYSECFDYDGLDEIINVFDTLTKNA